MKVGNIVKGISDEYAITNEKMTKAIVTKVSGEDITVKILEHEESEKGVFTIDKDSVEIIGEVKLFDRESVLELLRNGCKKAILDYNLRDADLSDADLSSADLRGADLSSADLRGADLRSANLRGANLSSANLRGADLRGADLRSANLRGANLSGANLSGANLSGADLSDADLSDADLSDADLRSANLRGADLRSANLRGADLDYSCFPLWCGGLHIVADKRLACQLAYHLCSMQCDDEEYIQMRNNILDFANQFHRAGECGKLEVLEWNDGLIEKN